MSEAGADLPWPPTVAAAARALASGETTAAALTDLCLARIDALDGKVDAYHRVLSDEACAEAAGSDRRRAAGEARGPLDGIPIAVKDVIEIAGQPCTANSRVLADNVAEKDAAVVARLREAGAVILGIVDTYEFAFGGRPTFDALFPPARNPWDLTRSTGGSSSGCGAAVAAGLCVAAIGSDAGGSIRLPAAFCGTAGIKPTIGRVSTAGVIPLTFSLDTVGPLTQTVEDAALVLAAIAGFDASDQLSADVPVPDYAAALGDDLSGLRIGLVRHFHSRDYAAPADIAGAVDGMADVLRGCGAEVAEVELPPLGDFHAVGRLIIPTEAYAIHEARLQRQWTEFGPLARNRMMLGAFARAVDYLQAQRRRNELAAAVEAALGSCDALVTAAMLAPAPPMDSSEPFPFLDAPMINVPFNLTDHPAVSVRCGFQESGMPVGAQIAARRWDEAMALRIACACERAAGWRERRPAL